MKLTNQKASLSDWFPVLNVLLGDGVLSRLFVVKTDIIRVNIDHCCGNISVHFADQEDKLSGRL